MVSPQIKMFKIDNDDIWKECWILSSVSTIWLKSRWWWGRSVQDTLTDSTLMMTEDRMEDFTAGRILTNLSYYISINITCRLTSNMPLFISPGSRKLKTEDVPEEQIIIEDELLELSRHYDSSLSRGSTLHQVISQPGSCRAFPFSNIIWGNIDNTLWLGSCGLSTVYSPAPTV